MALSNGLLWCLFIPFLGGKTVIPEPLTVYTQMLVLKPGMDRSQVEALVHLEKRLRTYTIFSLHGSSDYYTTGRDHTLCLHYRYEFERDKLVLKTAELSWGEKRVLQVSAAKREGKEPCHPQIDAALVEDAIRAVQGQNSPGK